MCRIPTGRPKEGGCTKRATSSGGTRTASWSSSAERRPGPALEEAGEVTQAAVRGLEGDDGRTEALAAYVVVEDGADVEAGELREHLGDYLDQAKIPGRYIELDEMPKTPSGKIDRKALPEPDGQMRSDERVEARGETESVLADIWCD
ncbi:MAG: hypothetical protein ABEN55_16430, partial [Bradymonadaceae bacterium]